MFGCLEPQWAFKDNLENYVAAYSGALLPRMLQYVCSQIPIQQNQSDGFKFVIFQIKVYYGS